jgi:hypothetical protein
MSPKSAIAAYLAYIVVVVSLVLLVGSELHVIGIPLNTLILTLGLLLTPIPTWILANKIHSEDHAQ